jgi:hypothetical protein
VAMNLLNYKKNGKLIVDKWSGCAVIILYLF